MRFTRHAIFFRAITSGFIFLCWMSFTALASADKTATESKPCVHSMLPDESLPLVKILQHSTIVQLQAQMEKGVLSAAQITRFYLEEIARKNPQLNAVIAVNPDALNIAQQRDQERAAGKLLGPLHGIPIAIKDNIETSSMATTAGSLALQDNATGRDAPLITRLKDAGAIIIAKANLSEWANFRSERSSSGWSAVGGQARNPHDLSRSPCGSSSGSAVMVAANLAVAAIGTETNGSIICPASINGIVGIKPTVGLVSRTGIVPISHTQDTAGPMTKSVADAALILSIIRGSDKQDAATEQAKEYMQQTFSAAVGKHRLKGKRIGVLHSASLAHEGVQALFKKAKLHLRTNGAVLVEDLKIEAYDGFWADSYEVLLYEFKDGLNQYLSSLPGSPKALTLEALIAFNRRHADTELQYFQQEIFEKSQSKGGLSDPAYLDALAKIRQATRKDGLDKLMLEHKLDAIVSPTIGPAWKIDLLNGDHFSGSFSSYPAISGYPHITLPMGKLAHMPVGVSLSGSAFTEPGLITIALVLEEALTLPR